MIFIDGLFDRRAFLFPIRHQLVDAARIHDGARNNVRADLLPFFENGDGQIRIELAKPISSGEAGRASADNKDIDFQTFTLRHKINQKERERGGSYKEFDRSRRAQPLCAPGWSLAPKPA